MRSLPIRSFKTRRFKPSSKSRVKFSSWTMSKVIVLNKIMEKNKVLVNKRERVLSTTKRLSMNYIRMNSVMGEP